MRVLIHTTFLTVYLLRTALLSLLTTEFHSVVAHPANAFGDMQRHHTLRRVRLQQIVTFRYALAAHGRV